MRISIRIGLVPVAVCAGLFLFGAVIPSAFAQAGDGCAESSNQRMTDAKRTEVSNVERSSGQASSTFSCQDVSGINETNRRANCVTGLCAGATTIQCCAPIGGGRPGAGTTPATTQTGTTGGVGHLVLPDCVDSGDCGLDDIIQTGVNFANFLFGISGAVFLAIFVYAGILYLTAGGNTGRVEEAKKKLVHATIGMLLVIGAGVLVTFVYDAFVSGGGGGTVTADTCANTKPGYVCTVLPEGDLQGEIQSRGCQTGLCPGARNNVCCPSQ